MSKVKDLTGQIFGQLYVLGPTQERANDGSMVWWCRCSCGKSTYISTVHLKKAIMTACKACRPDPNDLTGKVFGKLTVLEATNKRENRTIVWRCRCSCGRMVYANTWRIKTGVIYGCEECAPSRLHKRKNLVGQSYGELRVLELLSREDGEECRWLCRCVCGLEVERTTYQLLHNRNWCRTNHNDRHYNTELTGKQIGQLTVLRKLDKRDSRGSIMWLCQCSCGKEREYSADVLRGGRRLSCGCYMMHLREVSKMREGLHHIDGTCVELLRRKKRCDNTSGYTGVYRTQNGKWRAYIGFKGKSYYLGTFEEKEEAIRARQRGEEMHDVFLEWFYKENPENSNRGKKN